jgi:hypothetical protein
VDRLGKTIEAQKTSCDGYCQANHYKNIGFTRVEKPSVDARIPQGVASFLNSGFKYEQSAEGSTP